MAMSTGLSACANKQDTTTTSASTPTTAASTTSATVAETTTTVAPQDPLVLKFATSFAQTEAGGKIVQHFCDYVEDETAGVVTFQVSFDGELGSSGEELGLVSSEQVDMVALAPAQFAEKLPLLNFPAAAPPDAGTALDYFDHLVFANQDTAPLIQAEAAKNNVIFLGFASVGGNVLVSAVPFATLSELAGKKFGATGSASALGALGFDAVTSAPADASTNLSTGVIELTDMNFAQAVKLKLFDVAKYMMWDGTYSAGDLLTVNLDTWDSLTAETQQIMRDAAKDTAQYSLDLDEEDSQASIQTLTDSGVAVGTLTAADRTAWWNSVFQEDAADCMARAQKLGEAGRMATVLEEAARFTGLTWTP
jgi:TRAP-type C4-dicarboxylate transport system substrate-binding protein